MKKIKKDTEEGAEKKDRYTLKIGIVLFIVWMLINLLTTTSMFFLESEHVHGRDFWTFYTETTLFELFFVGMGVLLLVIMFWFARSIKKGNNVRKK